MMEKNDFAVLPYNSTLIKDRYLVTNALGSWDFLDKTEFNELNSFRVGKESPLFKRLYEKGIIADSGNIERLTGEFTKSKSNLFRDTSLHIAVLTTRCNLNCTYCQAKAVQQEDMDQKVAAAVLKYLFGVKAPSVTLEFQGGEPLLNWEALSFLVENARKFNTAGKGLRLALVSNLIVLDEEKMKFLVDNDVEICTSLDGPREIHDKNRIFKDGCGSYAQVMEKIEKLRNKFNKRVNFLPTITNQSLNNAEAIVDEYVRLGQREICLRPVNQLGVACRRWTTIGYSAEQFSEFYRKAVDYILDLNKKGIFIRERMARIILEKVINKKDPGYVDLMNPCGAGRNIIVYMPDGSCYPCDEARMVGEEMFKLGNILDEQYEDMMKKENLLHLLESSLVDLWDYSSAFSPWTGTCPVVNYSLQKNMVPKIWCSPLHKIYNFQFRYVFEKMLDNSENMGIFKSWIKEVPDEKK